MTVSRSVLALALAMFGFALPAAGQLLTPVGLWEAQNGRSRYTVTVCGRGQDLCAYVSWIRPDALNDRNRKFLHQPVFENLPLSGNYRWRGEVTIEGTTVNGTVELIAYDQLQITACMFILCDSTVLTRVR